MTLEIQWTTVIASPTTFAAGHGHEGTGRDVER